MSASTNLIGDMGTVVTNGPNAATLALAIAAAGPIMDYQANNRLIKLKLQEADGQLTLLLGVIDSGDGIKAGLTAVEHALTGLSAPSSTLITDMKTAITTGPSATTVTNSNLAAGPLTDFIGMMKSALVHLQEALVLIGLVITDTDSSDSSNLTLLQNVQTALS